MGEIGIPRYDFLYVIRFWEARRIIRGYNRRKRDLWSATRWETYRLLGCWADLKQSGIYKPADLIQFPWDNEALEDNGPSDEEVAEMQEMMRQMNQELQEQQKLNEND